MGNFPESQIYIFDSNKAQQSETYLNTDNLQELTTLKKFFLIVFSS